MILLTSRLHPDGKGAVADRPAVRGRHARRRGDRRRPAAARRRRRRPSRSRCGIDVLVRDGFAPLRGKRVGLVTNHTGRTARRHVRRSTSCSRPRASSSSPCSAPSTASAGLVDAEVADSKDEATGLPIFSLYGKTRKPTPESLRGSTSWSTTSRTSAPGSTPTSARSASSSRRRKEKGIPLFVLDRPNPIGGVAVAGPVRDAEFESFIAHHALPVRHGMTVGELARLFNAERKIGADLTVDPLRGLAARATSTTGRA